MNLLKRIILRKCGAATDHRDLLAAVRDAMAKSDDILLHIFRDHCRDFLDRDSDYIVFAVCGASENGPLDGRQTAIHNSIQPAVTRIYDMLEIGSLSEEQKKAVLFIIRFMTALKLLYMTELLRNLKNPKSEQPLGTRNPLEEMEARGHA